MGVTALNLPQSPRDAVFRAMEKIVRTSPTFGRVVKPTSFRTWSGKPDDPKEFSVNVAPCMRWTPTNRRAGSDLVLGFLTDPVPSRKTKNQG